MFAWFSPKFVPAQRYLSSLVFLGAQQHRGRVAQPRSTAGAGDGAEPPAPCPTAPGGAAGFMWGWVPALQSYFLYFSVFLWHLMQGLELMALGQGAALWGTLQAAHRSQPSRLQLPAVATTLPLPFGLSLRATSLQG